MPSIYDFVTKEGKQFAAIVNEVPKMVISGTLGNYTLTQDGNKMVSGVKGTYAKVKMTLPAAMADTKRELFAVGTQAFKSSE